MFKKFTVDDLSSTSQIKNSVQRSIIAQIIEQYPPIELVIDDILPKKSFSVAKATDGIQLIIVNNEIKFFSIRDGPFFPTLKVLHQYPSIMSLTQLRVDKGAINFVLGGANIMCPGFTSPGGSMPVPIEADQPVAIYAEGKQHAMALGITKMSTAQIKSVNKGIAVESVHFLRDGLWLTNSV